MEKLFFIFPQLQWKKNNNKFCTINWNIFLTKCKYMSLLGYYLLQKRIHANSSSPEPLQSSNGQSRLVVSTSRLNNNSLLRRVSLLCSSMDRHNTKVLHKRYSFYIYVHLTNINMFITFYMGYLQLYNWNNLCQWGIEFCNISMLRIYSTRNTILFIKVSYFTVAIFELCAQKQVCLLFFG